MINIAVLADFALFTQYWFCTCSVYSSSNKLIIQHEKLGLDGSIKHYVVVGYVSLPLLLKRSTLVGSPWQWTSLGAYIKFCQLPIRPLTSHAGSKAKARREMNEGHSSQHKLNVVHVPVPYRRKIAFRQKVMYGVAIHNSR